MLKGGPAAATTSLLVLCSTSSGRWMLLILVGQACVGVHSMVRRLRLEAWSLIGLVVQVRTRHHSIVLLLLVKITTNTSIWLVIVVGDLGLMCKVSVDVDVNIYIAWRLVMNMLWLIWHIVVAHGISFWWLRRSKVWFLLIIFSILAARILFPMFFLLFDILISHLIWSLRLRWLRLVCRGGLIGLSSTTLFCCFFALFRTVLVLASALGGSFWGKLWILLNKTIVNFDTKIVRMTKSLHIWL